MLMSKEREAEKTLPERWSAKAKNEVVLRLSIAPATSPVSALASPRLSLMFPRSGSRAAACSRPGITSAACSHKLPIEGPVRGQTEIFPQGMDGLGVVALL